MALPVIESPQLPVLLPPPDSITKTNAFLRTFALALFNVLRTHALRLNSIVSGDGSESYRVPLRGAETTVAGLAAFPADIWVGSWINVTDEAGGYVPAFSDGADWRRVTDRAVVS